MPRRGVSPLSVAVIFRGCRVKAQLDPQSEQTYAKSQKYD